MAIPSLHASFQWCFQFHCLYALSFSAWQFLHKSHALSLLRLAAVTSSRPSPSLPSSLQKAHPKIHVQFPNLDQCLYHLTHTDWALRSPFPSPSTSCPMPGPSNFLLLPALYLRVHPHIAFWQVTSEAVTLRHASRLGHLHGPPLTKESILSSSLTDYSIALFNQFLFL